MLKFVRVGEGLRHAILIHGIMGSSRNVMTIAKLIVQKFPAWQLILPDLDHDATTVKACAEEVLELITHYPSPDFDKSKSPSPSRGEGITVDMLIGHSFGGKVVLALNELMPVKQVWVWDAEPGLKPPEHTYETVQKLKQISMPQPSRQAVQQAILAQGLSRDIAAWMTTNLIETPQGYVWRFDLNKIDALLISFGNTAIEPQSNTDFVRAERSSHMILGESERVHVLKNAGHWVHIDNPAGLLDIMQESFIE